MWTNRTITLRQSPVRARAGCSIGQEFVGCLGLVPRA